MYYRETSAARTELAQGTEAKVRTQNFRKTPRQCDRSLHKEPPQMELNDNIREAVRKRELSYFSFFLHRFEKRLKGVIYRFLTRSGYDRYDPAQFLDYKLEVLQMLLYCLPKFDPEQKTEFLKYAKHYIRDGLLFCRMIGEAGSFASLAEYRRVRQIGAIYNNSGKSRAEVVSEFAAQSGYKDESGSADELLSIAQRNRSIVSLYRTEQDEDSEETGEDVTRDDSWNYADILWNGIQAKAVAAAFDQLSYKEQWYLEKRNAICMTCGRISPLSTQSTFEDLAVDFDGTAASGAERFYRRTLDKLRLKLPESGLVHTVTMKQTECRKRNKKQPPLSTCIRRTTTANGVRFGLILKAAQRRLSNWQIGTRCSQTFLQKPRYNM